MGDLEPGVALTFDDASIDPWIELLPMFQKYNVHATFFICTSCSENPLDKSKLKQLADAGNEIGSHTMHHYHLSEYLRNHTIDEYLTNEIIPTLQYFDTLNIPITSFAYPYGEHNSSSDKLLSKYFQKIRGISSMHPSENGAYIIHKYEVFIKGADIDRALGYTLNDFKNAILEAKSHNAVLVLLGHSPGPDASNDWSFPVPLLDSICNYTVRLKMKFYRLQDL